MNELSKDLRPEMLPEGIYRDIAVAIGPENFVKLAEIIGGATVYIPKPESIVRPVRDARIKQEFNGYNHLELARRYSVTDRWVRQICGEGNLEGQVSLLDLLPEA